MKYHELLPLNILPQQKTQNLRWACIISTGIFLSFIKLRVLYISNPWLLLYIQLYLKGCHIMFFILHLQQVYPRFMTQ